VWYFGGIVEVEAMNDVQIELVWILPLSVAGIMLICALIIIFWIEPRSRKRPH
jgi:hypothetical protein